MILGFCDSYAYQVRAACGRMIGMSVYTSVPEDGRTCLIFGHLKIYCPNDGCLEDKSIQTEDYQNWSEL